ncbi:replication-relaxation family protein [Gimesia fumaroli]|uniref:Replication-relaxation n=1 Tax=Gimesia fumaroli TaxID=2527976 RepID=A0A518I5L7_9PLAN|nr:replication-relaxation family protein [Gimesia fumaroli]QDV48404.1 hypothetical protein Enr17x_04160 [Gimesia fumaroli]QDV48472.1 hypothetical protein Enr17x_04840 [Gimesia fumaroli]
MTTKSLTKLRWQKTARDDDILAALARCPLTAEEILKLSQTWSQPFLSLRRVQERMKDLTTVGQLHSWRYATTGPGGARLYYKLTLAGYRTVMQDDQIEPPTKRFFHEISPGRHRHQRALSQFIVQTYVAAYHRGIKVIDFHPENTFRIDCGERPLWPDARFTLALPNGTQFSYCVELDNSTESVLSYKSADSISNKMGRYLVDMVVMPQPYRVLFAITGSPDRLQHIIDAAGQYKISEQSLAPFYVVWLDDYLAHPDAFFRPCFHSPQNVNIPLLRSQSRQFPVSSPFLERPKAL